MKILWMLLLACGAACAQGPLTLAVCSSGCSSSAPISFPDTPQYSDNSIELEFSNSSSSAVRIVNVSLSDTVDFYTNASINYNIPSGENGPFFLAYFTPQNTGPASATFTVTYCTPSSEGTWCLDTPKTETIATLQGNGTAPQIVLTCSGQFQQCDDTPLTPIATLHFGFVADGSSISATFTLKNDSQSAANVSLQTSDPFSSDPSAPVPATVAAGSSTTFTVDFSPTQAGLSQATLIAGSSSFSFDGSGIDVGQGGTPLKFQVCGDQYCSSTTALYTPWNLPDTSEGAETHLILRPVNPTTSKVKLINVAFQQDTEDFSITNEYVDEIIAPGAAGTPFSVHFTPQNTGGRSAILDAFYCLPDASGNCPGTTSLVEAVVKLQGNGTPPQVTLTCSGSPQCDGTPLRPASILDFGSVTVGSTASITFTVTNNSQSAVSVALPEPVYGSTPFSVSPTGMLPASVSAAGSATFVVNFTPGSPVLSQSAIVVGSSTFPLQGFGTTSTVDPLSQIVVTYTNMTKGDPSYGDRLTAEGPGIDFGQVVSGASKTFQVSVCNPYTTYGDVSISKLDVSGSGFTATGMPSLPVTIPPAADPNDCQTGAGPVDFDLEFTAAGVGNSSGTLTIGTRTIPLTAQTVAPPLSGVSFQLSEEPLTSDQQPNLTLQLASPSQGTHDGTLTMTFQPSVQSVGDDPAVRFLATNGRQLNVEFATGSQTGTYNNQSAIAFQTGTTAGTLTFTLSVAGIQVGTKSFDISPEKVHIASATATLSSPNIVVTINGYDNTYSVGQLSFTFYDTKGNVIAPGAIAVDASSDFHQYFFTNNKAGGAFALQASFPVLNGDASGVGSVSVTLNNSEGSVTTKLTVQ
ncbi:MAG TPA: choice-of-anchor D domain-containing protein [Bryobacteraceae bacterium]